MLRVVFPELHPHNRHRHLLSLDFFVVSLQHKSGARPMASTLLNVQSLGRKLCDVSVLFGVM